MCERELARPAGLEPAIPGYKENNVRKGFFEPEQFKSVKNHLPVHMQPIVEFAYNTAWCTPSEILPFEWRQVDMKAGEVRLDAGTTKNGEGRVFPFTMELRRVFEGRQALAERLKRENGAIARYVLLLYEGKKTGKRITESGFNKAWRKARIDAGYPGRIPHDFRRTAVRNLVRAGAPERVGMHLTGHKTRAVFERYNIVSAGDLRDAARRLDSFIASRTEARRLGTRGPTGHSVQSVRMSTLRGPGRVPVRGIPYLHLRSRHPKENTNQWPDRRSRPTLLT